MTFVSKLTTEMEEQVAALTRAKKSQDEIAAVFNVHRNTIYRAQQRLGLRVQPVPPKKEIIKLLKVEPRLTYEKIAEMTGSSKSTIKKIAKRNGLGRHTGIPESVHAALVEDILARRDYTAALSRKYAVPYRATLALVKQTLGCAGLRQGHPAIPLESFFPQRWPKHFAAKPDADKYVLALEGYFDRFHNGKLTPPENDAALIAAFLRYVPDYLQSEYGMGFGAGLDLLRRQKNLQWTN